MKTICDFLKRARSSMELLAYPSGGSFSVDAGRLVGREKFLFERHVPQFKSSEVRTVQHVVLELQAFSIRADFEWNFLHSHRDYKLNEALKIFEPLKGTRPLLT
jgi:hypothetical protein